MADDAFPKAYQAAVDAYLDSSPTPVDLLALRLAVQAAVERWEREAPPRGDGYDCARGCAHCCSVHTCEDC